MDFLNAQLTFDLLLFFSAKFFNLFSLIRIAENRLPIQQSFLAERFAPTALKSCFCRRSSAVFLFRKKEGRNDEFPVIFKKQVGFKELLFPDSTLRIRLLFFWLFLRWFKKSLKFSSKKFLSLFCSRKDRSRLPKVRLVFSLVQASLSSFVLNSQALLSEPPSAAQETNQIFW